MIEKKATMQNRKLVALVALSLVLALIALLTSRLPWRLLPWQWRERMEQVLLRHWQGPKYLGDGQPASNLLLCNPMGLAVDSGGDLLVSDRGRDLRGRVVWRI